MAELYRRNYNEDGVLEKIDPPVWSTTIECARGTSDMSESNSSSNTPKKNMVNYLWTQDMHQTYIRSITITILYARWITREDVQALTCSQIECMRQEKN